MTLREQRRHPWRPQRVGDPNTAWIPDYLKGRRVYVLGCGPSLVGFRWEYLKRERERGAGVVAINQSIRYFKNPDVLIYTDGTFPACRGIPPLKSLPCKVIAAGVPGPHAGGNICVVSVTHTWTGLNPLNGWFAGKYTATGIRAICAALAMGASEIVLLGLDHCDAGEPELNRMAKEIRAVGRADLYDFDEIERNRDLCGSYNKRITHFYSFEKGVPPEITPIQRHVAMCGTHGYSEFARHENFAERVTRVRNFGDWDVDPFKSARAWRVLGV